MLPRRPPWNESLAFDIWFDSGKMNDGFDSHNGLDSHDSHNGHDALEGHDAAMYQEIASYTVVINAIRPACRKFSHPKNQCPSSENRWINAGNPHNGHDKFFAPRQTGKGLILSEEFFLADISIPFFTFGSADIRFAERELVWGDLHGCKSLTNNQAGGTFQRKGICDGSPRRQ